MGLSYDIYRPWRLSLPCCFLAGEVFPPFHRHIDVGRLGALDKIIDYARSSSNANRWPGSGQIDTVVHVCHGPVHYKDSSGCIATQEDWFDPHAGPRAWFTKKMCLTSQCEYRFAVSTIGDPVKPTHHIDVSPELRELTSAL